PRCAPRRAGSGISSRCACASAASGAGTYDASATLHGEGSMSEPLDRELVAFLLGGLEPDAEEAIERRLFTEGGLAGRRRETADELIVAYLSGTLPEAERVRFQSHFLASQAHRERLRFMEGLLTAVGRVEAAEPRPRHAEGRHWSLLAAVLLIAVALGVVLVALPFGGGPRIAGTPTSTVTPTTSPTPVAPPVTPAATRVVLPKTPSGSVAIGLGSQTASVRLEIPVSPAPSFSASLRDAKGGEVWRAEELDPPAAGQPLVLTVPAQVFASDRYALLVEGEPLRGD